MERPKRVTQEAGSLLTIRSDPASLIVHKGHKHVPSIILYG